ncbi:MAG: ATP-binding protein, partial [Myxococcota bacterium]
WLVAFLSAGWVWVTLPAALGGVALVGAGISRRWERARRGRLILAERVERDRLVTATVAHTADGVLVTDQSFSVRYSNHAARMLLQLDSHAPSLAGLSDELRLDTGELTLSRAEDSGLAERFVAFVRSDMRLEGELHWIYTLRDVTETRELERLKAQLVSSMSHELKNPLTSIHAALKMMQAGILGEMPQASRGSLNAASAASERMVRLIDDTLEAERRSDSDLQIRVQAVESWNDLVSSAVALHDLTAAQASVELVFSPGEDTELWVDSDRIHQVIANLLSNALKYSDPGGAVQVTTDRLDGYVTIRVRDQGPGIPTEFQDRIFERGSQAENARAGSGLGLNIAHQIVVAHGGEISVDSVLGKGSTFTVTLPKTKQALNS